MVTRGEDKPEEGYSHRLSLEMEAEGRTEHAPSEHLSLSRREELKLVPT